MSHSSPCEVYFRNIIVVAKRRCRPLSPEFNAHLLYDFASGERVGVRGISQVESPLTPTLSAAMKPIVQSTPTAGERGRQRRFATASMQAGRKKNEVVKWTVNTEL